MQSLTAKTKIELCMLLPAGNGCAACTERLQKRIQQYRGIELAHLELQEESPRVCVHYDPNLASLEYVRSIATEEGAHLEWRFRHETLSIQGLDCVDCARTLEAGLQRLAGVLWVSANVAAGTMAVEYDSDQVGRSAIVSRIQALGHEVSQPAAATETIYQVQGLDCADCALHLEEAVRRAPGVAEVSVDFSLARLRVASLDGPEIRSTVQRLAQEMGYTLLDETAGRDGEAGKPSEGWWRRIRPHRRVIVTVVSGLLIALAVTIRLLGAPEPSVAATYIAAIVIGGSFIARSGWAALRTARTLDMNALMTIAAVGAIFVGEWAEGAVAIFLFAMGNALESHTMDRARRSIRGLMDLSPRRATVLHGSQEDQVAVTALRVGDRILVRPGERVPMDGLVLAGESAVNQAPVTGESVPVDKSPGSTVFAGTVNGQGALTVRVTQLASDTTIARIIKMVEEAQAQKAPSQRLVDRFARVYTPAVILTAAGIATLPPVIGWLTGTGTFGALFSQWLYRALVLLVIACPCALVISTPVSIVSAIASAARAGILIKGGAHLEALGALKAIAFDKTGTLTTGQPQVVQVLCIDHPPGLSWTECGNCVKMVTDAAAVERRSEHPLARAVVRAAEEQGLMNTLPEAETVEAITGRGVRGRVDGHSLTVGTHTYIHESQPELVEGPLCDAVHAAQAAGQTAMVVRDDCCGVRGFISVADTLRSNAPGVMASLRKVGIKASVMLTGDNMAAAQAVGALAGVDRVQADLLPDQKVIAIEGLLKEHGHVAMIGDGVNDAPALARATVGVAMGAAGTDAALETADVALMADDLGKLPTAIVLSQRARGIIRQNVALSLGIKAAFLALAITGLATLWMAVFADVGASLIVTLNGMRLLRQS